MVRRKPYSRKPARRVGPRVLVWSIAVLVVLFLAHGALTRWLLSGKHLRSWINTHPETTLLEYDEASSVWPGTVRLKNFRIRGSDQNVEWIVRLSEARADYSILALLKRTFRVTRLTGSGLSFRLRQKLKPSDPSNPPIAVLPSILGFSDPPLRRPAAETAPEEEGNPWTVAIDGIALDRFEEIWVDAYRFEGSARLLGEFTLKPGQRARVGPADITFANGILTLGKHPLLSPFGGRIRASIAQWDPRRVQGDAVWRGVSADIDLHGPSPGLEFLNYYFRSSPEPRFSGGRAVLSLTGEIDHGKASGRAHLAAKTAKARLADVDLTGDIRVSLRIPAWKLDGGGMDLSSSSLQFTDVTASGAEDTRHWWARIALPQARVEDGLFAKVKLECRDARPLLAALKVGLPGWTRGLLTLEGLTAEANVELADSRTGLHELEARGGKFHILGEYERHGKAGGGVFLIESDLLRVGIEVGDADAGVRLVGVRGWFFKERLRFTQAARKPSASPS